MSPVSIKLDNILFPDVAEKRRIWIEALNSQLVRFEEMQWDNWLRKFIFRLCPKSANK